MKLTPSKDELKLKELIEKAKKILLLAHVRIDEDAVCTMLLNYYLIKKYFPTKNVEMILQEHQYQWPRFSKLQLVNLERIRNVPTSEQIEISKYDLVILHDVDEIKRCLTNYNGKSKVAIIDHHDSPTPEKYEVKINELRSSATEQLYITYKRIFGKKFKIDEEISKLVHVGIFADTGRFLYSKVTEETYKVMSEIKSVNNINTEILWKNINNMDTSSVKVLGESIRNMKIVKNLCYSYIDEKFQKENCLTSEQIKSGISDNFLSSIARYIQGVDWAFVIFPISDNTWKVGFRAIGNTENVERFARALGGGGHKAAASTNIEAKTTKEAIRIVLDTIASNPS